MPAKNAHTPSAGAVLTRAQVLGASDIKIERVAVPEWGGDVFVKGLTGAERDAFEGSMLTANGRGVSYVNVRAKLAARAICDEGGSRLFTDADIEALAKKSAGALERVADVARRLSGMSQADLESLTGSLKNAPSDGSISD